MTWGRKTGGRKKGTPNKIKKPPALMAEAQAEVAAAVSANECLQPLDYMLAVMRDPMASGRAATRWQRRPHPTGIRNWLQSRIGTRTQTARRYLPPSTSSSSSRARLQSRLSRQRWRRRRYCHGRGTAQAISEVAVTHRRKDAAWQWLWDQLPTFAHVRLRNV